MTKIAIAAIYDPLTNLVLVGKRKYGKNLDKVPFAFPHFIIKNEEATQEFIDSVKDQTGIEISVRAIAERIVPSKDPESSLTTYICQPMGGQEKESTEFSALAWVPVGKLRQFLGVSLSEGLEKTLKGIAEKNQE